MNYSIKVKTVKPPIPTKSTEPLIVISLNLARVLDVTFVAEHVLEQQMIFEVWPHIKPHLDRIDRDLRKLMTGVIAELKRQDSASTVEHYKPQQ